VNENLFTGAFDSHVCMQPLLIKNFTKVGSFYSLANLNRQFGVIEDGQDTKHEIFRGQLDGSLS